MQALRKRLPRILFATVSSSSLSSPRTLTVYRPSLPLTNSSNGSLARGTFVSPWSAIQHRGAKVLGSDVRLGNVIQRKGRIYQVELRDVDTGNKITERFRTDEAIERVFVEDKSFTFLYAEGDSIMIMEPNTFEQMEIHKDMFGKNAAYLKDDMAVTLQFYDGKLMSASVPHRVTCTIAEAQDPMKGITATPQYKRALLDNGLTVMVPSFIRTGDEVVINTTDDSYITRAKE
ncbi:PREDICTED: uncharacterized protein LOC104597664 isoform X2 [Nelumbo nucifera]|uniref:Uncharacterized protein LOC104597664 isoform X2 n=1 Tax=Nelumbo nucifera TaxID=4432 RepID=A0A1U8A6Y2_NELNU|nr:PREDICTED: uncharacterized protein LOC104597664 isoform X2 [Nelumbo nucifera]